MFANELFSSFFLVFFAALLCLFGLGMLIDGIVRLFREAYKSRPVVESTREPEAKASTPQQAA